MNSNYLVEVAVLPEGLRDALLKFDALHREHRIPVYRGRIRQGAERFHIRFCSRTVRLRTHSAVESVVSASSTRLKT
jgi:hypothetical protein